MSLPLAGYDDPDESFYRERFYIEMQVVVAAGVVVELTKLYNTVHDCDDFYGFALLKHNLIPEVKVAKFLWFE